MAGGLSSTNYTSCHRTLRVRNDKKLIGFRDAKYDKAAFVNGMIGIGKYQVHRVSKNRFGFIEGNAVFVQISFRFLGVPFKIHAQL